ncbi:acyl-CoA thioesterase [Microtetraspora malaysiensis]|uniref:acyl-CoA thioesterase n=1 Tax=Microtetraspora malaysiensis TaxID=161358 RepID=UPI003D938C7D
MGEHMDEYAVPLDIRFHDIDGQGHLNSAVYHSYAEHARWCHLRSLGVLPEDLRGGGVGPVLLESTIRFRREVRAGQTIRVTVAYEWGEPHGRTFVLRQAFLFEDGAVAAEMESVCGLLDLNARKLIVDPRGYLAGLSPAAHDAFGAFDVFDGGAE